MGNVDVNEGQAALHFFILSLFSEIEKGTACEQYLLKSIATTLIIFLMIYDDAFALRFTVLRHDKNVRTVKTENRNFSTNVGQWLCVRSLVGEEHQQGQSIMIIAVKG